MSDETATPEPRYPMSQEQRRSLSQEVRTIDAAYGEDFSVACNADPEDHLHTRRLGLPGDAHSRVGVAIHASSALSMVYIHPTEARMLAAALLNLADELDGTTPLVFFPPSPESTEPTPKADGE